MSGSKNGAPMNGGLGGNPAIAAHLADLDASYEGHLAAIRDRAEHARDVVRNGSDALESMVHKPLDLSSVPVDESFAQGTSRPSYYDNTTVIPNSAILADTPLGAVPYHVASPAHGLEDVTLDDDGIPLWQD